MKIIDDGGPVHPVQGTWRPEGNGGTFYPGHSGLSLRDYFAGQALAGLCANLEYIADAEMTYVDIADKAYNQADAMIAARSGHGRPTGEA